jgi:hypothetical protein
MTWTTRIAEKKATLFLKSLFIIALLSLVDGGSDNIITEYQG